MSDWYRGSERPEMLALIPARRSTVLEVGCGEGRFAASIPGVTETWGVEPDAGAAAIAGRRLSHVLQSTFDAAKEKLPQAYFDVIVCNDVIEHLVDHDQFLEDAKVLLATGGVLVASIPNVRHYLNLFELLVARDWEYREAGILDRTHLRFFTARSLRRTLRQHGYRIDLFRGINGGIRVRWSKWGLMTALFGYLMIALSLGRSRDIIHPQFAVRASITDGAPAGPTTLS